MGFTKKYGSLHGTESGQAMVEFLLVVLFVFLVFVSLVQFILLMYAYTTLANAAKEGVRYAVTHGTGSISGSCSVPGPCSVPCSGPGTPPNAVPKVTCTDWPQQNVTAAVTNFAGLSFQNVSNGNVTVSYDPGGANTTLFHGQCSAPGCLVKVTVSHPYTPLFLSWLNVTLNAAAEGSIIN